MNRFLVCEWYKFNFVTLDHKSVGLCCHTGHRDKPCIYSALCNWHSYITLRLPVVHIEIPVLLGHILPVQCYFLYSLSADVGS